MAVRHLGLIWLLLLGQALPASALMAPPESPAHRLPWEATLLKSPANELRLGGFFARLEKTTLTDVRKRAGTGTIHHAGDAGNSERWLCYTAPHARLWLVSNEMGGAVMAMTHFYAEVIAQTEATSDCPPLPPSLQAISIDPGIWLGTSKAKVQHILGSPTKRQNGWDFYNFEGKAPGDCPPNGFDRLNHLHIRFKGEQIDAIDGGQVTSC